MNKSEYKHKRIGGRKGAMKLAHHVVWENAYGSIPAGFQIHHIDHNKHNNHLENLMLLTASDHQKFHSPYYFKINGEWVHFCKDCKELNDNPKTYTSCKKCRARKARIERRELNEKTN